MMTGKKRALFALLLALTMVFSVAFGTVSALATWGTTKSCTIAIQYKFGDTVIATGTYQQNVYFDDDDELVTVPANYTSAGATGYNSNYSCPSSSTTVWVDRDHPNSETVVFNLQAICVVPVNYMLGSSVVSTSASQTFYLGYNDFNDGGIGWTRYEDKDIGEDYANSTNYNINYRTTQDEVTVRFYRNNFTSAVANFNLQTYDNGGHIDFQHLTLGGKTITGVTIVFNNSLGSVSLSHGGGLASNEWGTRGNAYTYGQRYNASYAVVSFGNPAVREYWSLSVQNCPNHTGIDLKASAKTATKVDVTVNRYYEDPANPGTYLVAVVDTSTYANQDAGTALDLVADTYAGSHATTGYAFDAADSTATGTVPSDSGLTLNLYYELSRDAYTVTVRYVNSVGGAQVGNDIAYASGVIVDGQPIDVNVDGRGTVPSGFALAAGEDGLQTVTVGGDNGLNPVVEFLVTQVAQGYSYIINVEYRYDGNLVRTGNSLTAFVGGFNPLDITVTPDATIIPEPYYLLGTDPKVVTVSQTNNVQTVVFELNSDEVPLAIPDDEVPLAEPTTGTAPNMLLIVLGIALTIGAVGLSTISFLKQKKSEK